MLKLFRKIRYEAMSKNKFLQYTGYAIGEITLVVIGILIAVQINNANESRKRDKLLQSVLKNVSYDLVADTTVVGQFIKIEEDMVKNSNQIIKKELNLSNFRECPKCASLVTTYRPFKINIKGYEQLKNLIDENSSQQDSLSTNIVQFYTQFINLIENSNTMLKNEALRNMEDFRQFDWFVDWTQANFNKEMIEYFTSSEDYRKRVAAYNILAEKNHLLYLKSYYTNSVHLLNLINKRLEKSRS